MSSAKICGCLAAVITVAIIASCVMNPIKERYIQWPPDDLVKGVSPQPYSYPASNKIFEPSPYRYEVRGPIGDMFLPGPAVDNAQYNARGPIGDMYIGDPEQLNLNWDGRYSNVNDNSVPMVQKDEVQFNAWAWR